MEQLNIGLLFAAAFLGVHFGYCRGITVGRRQERRKVAP